MNKTEGSFADVAAGTRHSLAIKKGELWSFGSGSSGQRGVRNYGEMPTRIGDLSDWESVFAGGDSSFAIRKGELWAWGSNSLGKLGVSEPEGGIIERPTRVGNSSGWTSVSAGTFHTLGIASGRLFAWGANYSHQCGLGRRGVFAYPVQVGEHDDWTHISAGGVHSLAVRDGKLYTWGIVVKERKRGQVKTPRQIGRDSGWEEVAAGMFRSFAIKNGVLHSWGETRSGQIVVVNGRVATTPLPGGPHANIVLPVPISRRSDWKSVCVNTDTAAGIANSSVFFWGKNPLRLTLAEGEDEKSIMRADDSFSWEKVSAGGNHLLGVRDGEIVSWGADEFGQLGAKNQASPPLRRTPELVYFPKN